MIAEIRDNGQLDWSHFLVVAEGNDVTPRRGRFWGAERIRGELLKLGITVCKRTIQKYMRGVRTRRGGQT
jgi:hypothetical protein